MTMLKTKYNLLIIGLLLLFFGCYEEEESPEEELLGNWTKVTPFKGRPRAGTVTFTIDSKAFVGLGYDGDEYLSDFYSYDVAEGFWQSRKPFPGVSRERAVTFTLNGKGYIGLGYNREQDTRELGDFWEYDPSTDTWTQLPDFGGSARYGAVSFVVGSRAFVGTGYDGGGYNSDMWEFDPTTGEWQEVQGYPGEKIGRGASFVIGSQAYLCSGRNNGMRVLDFWEFDPEGMSWKRLTKSSSHDDYTDFKLAVQRHDAVTFTIGNYAYIMGGITSGASGKSIFEYRPDEDEWVQKTDFEGSGRSLASAFVLDGRAFVGTGQNGSNYYDDVWEFKPFEEYDEEN